MTSETLRSSNSKMLLIMSFSLCSIEPFSLPTSTIMRISSSVASSGSSPARTPNRRASPRASAPFRSTKGRMTQATNQHSRASAAETPSGWRQATR